MTSHTLSRADLAQFVDYTLLKPEATRADVDALVADAAELGVFAVCVSPSFLPVEAPGGLTVVTVAGCPSGKHHSAVKAAEAARGVADGAHEVDMVIDVGAAVAEDFDAVRRDIEAVRAAVPAPGVLKVIIESAALTDHQIVETSRAAAAAGADFVKTSTGFHPAGGASAHAVRVIAGTVGGRLGVKASGGIRTTAQALELIEAGATRLGVSAARAILDGLGPDGVASAAAARAETDDAGY